ncbi:T9SS type A sorting domain-containing protein [Flammeovirga sp. SJP92]|uniref:T9SS type A sorting domain-containing protein n=1 Tax=Flammeovirga sp. SJP92 TaxID=1775430 RepID=UPI000786E920|nr:T9SS type A sorting domain-containing protein [Flammeovirga sp. SJP92]KXX68489.1 hypothetical protein AVL50_22240 [Flammeovirga sp. SJP92]
MLSINYYKLLFISSILLISYNSFAIDGCSADYSSGRVTIGDGNLIFNESCQVFSESTITLENDGNYRTILVGDATENLSVLIEASQLILEPDPNDILELIIEAQDTLVIIGDLRLFNNSTVTVKDNGVLIIHGSLLTEGDEDTPEKSSKVNINVAAEGQIHVNEDAILNYSSGNLEGLIIVPNGKIESYSIEGEVPGWLLGWLALCEWLFPDSQYTQDLRDTVDEIRNGGKIGDIDFDQIKDEYPGDIDNPFTKDYPVDISLPITARGLDFFDETGIYTQPIFTSENLEEILSNGNVLSLLGKEIAFTVQSEEDKNCMLYSTFKVNSVGGLKDALGEMTWKLPTEIEDAIEKRNGGDESDNQMILDYFINKTIKIEVVESGSVSERVTVDGQLGGSTARIATVQSSGNIIIDFESQVPGDLPVELIYFRGAVIGEEVELEWKTASEINASHFEVQRSSDRKNWINLGTVEASGNSQTAIEYTFTDEKPLAVSYYRLKQVDFDEAFEFFGPVAVTLEGVEEALELLIMPNNILNSENVQFSISGLNVGTSMSIQVFNNNGYLVYSEDIAEVTSNNLLKPMHFTKQLGSGMYYVVVKSGKNIVKERLLVR